jgi:hypothetical protein
MRFLLLLVSVATAGSLLGQSGQNAVPHPEQLIERTFRAQLRSYIEPVKPVITLSRSSACSVPLLEMAIPDGKNFTIILVPAPQNFTDHMVIAGGLPACTKAAEVIQK